MGILDFVKYVLGKDEPEFPSAIVPASAPIPEPNRTCDALQFSIEDGVLVKYNGIATEVVVPDGVTAIGGGAFADSTVRFVSLPDSVTEIRNGAFKYCGRLEKIDLSETLQSIGSHAFWKCYSLKYLDVPNSVASIGMSAFEECKSLVRVNIPHSLTEIGMSVFQDCESLARIDIPENIVRIEASAFRGCSILREIRIPDSVESIGSHCFCDCSSLMKVVIPDTVPNLKSGIFQGCTALQTIEIPDSVLIIYDMAFGGCVSLDNVVIPDSVYQIKDNAFFGCASLTNVCLSVKTVWKRGNDIFKGCPYESEYIRLMEKFKREMESYIPADIRDWEYERDLFGGIEIKRYKGSNSDVTVPSYITTTPVTIISNNAFYNSPIERVSLPDTICKIGPNAFANCYDLKSVNIPNRLTDIESNSFSGCRSLEKLVFSKRMRRIEVGAFADCRSLKSITLPKRLFWLDSSAFNGCTELTEVRVEQGNKYYCDIDGVLFSADKADLLLYPSSKIGEEYRVPNGVTHIPKFAFGDCCNLKRLFVPKSVQNMNLSHLSMSSVEEMFFEDMPRLDDVCGDVYPLRLVSQKYSAKQWKGKKAPLMVARGWVNAKENGMHFPDDVAEENKEYLRKNRRYFFRLLDRDISLLKYMCEEKLLTQEVVQGLFEKAKEDPSLMAVLLEYTKDIFPETDFGDDTYNLE